MPIEAHFDKLRRHVQAVKKHSRQAFPDILKKNMLKVLIGGSTDGQKFDGLVQLTPKAQRSEIESDAREMVTTTTKDGRSHTAPRIIAIAAKELTNMGIRPGGWDAASQAVWRDQVRQLAKAILALRMKGIGVIAAGWLEAAMNFGARGSKKGGTQLYPGGIAAQGFGVMPTESHLVATSHNVVPGARLISMPQLPRAIANAIKDMRFYLRRKITEAIAKARQT